MILINKRYEIIRFLGSGNYGLTYLVYDKKNRNEIALKISDINASSKKVVSQLIQQFYILKQINNPFIIRPYVLEKIFNIDNSPFERDIWFYTMPYISNSVSIDLYLKENIDKPEKIFSLCSKLIYAINFLHNFDISHNDIQKQNVLINEYGNPVLLDIFPVRISSHQYYEDNKQLFKLIKESLLDVRQEIPEIIDDFFNYSFENQYDYNLMKKWLYEKANIRNQHLYFFNNDKITSVSFLNLQKDFEKIKEKLSSKNIILWEDSDSFDSLKDNFHAFLKVKVQNVVFIKTIEDFFEYLSFKSGQNITNISEAEIYLKSSFFQDSLYLLFDNYLHLTQKEKNFYLNLSNYYREKIYLIRFELFENEKDKDWLYHRIYLDDNRISSALNVAFNWYRFDFSQLGFNFSVSTLFNFLLFIKSNQNYIKANDNQILLTKKQIDNLKENYFNYIFEKYKLSELTEEENLGIIIFLTFSKPVPTKILYSIEKFKIKKSVYLSLLNKNILKYHKATDSLGINENIISEMLRKKLIKRNKTKYLDFQNYLYENWGSSIDDKKNYIKNLKLLKSEKLLEEVLLFYKNFSIFTYYPDYSEVYDLIFNFKIEEGNKEYCEYFKQYFYYSLATLDLKKLKKLQVTIKNISICNNEEEELKNIFDILISLVIAGISYNLDEVDRCILMTKNFIENPFVSLIVFYTYSNLLNWEKEAKEYYKYVVDNLDKYNNLEYFFFLYGLAALKKIEEKDKSFENYASLMSILYNDSKEEKNWIFYLKASHNLAVYYSSLDTEEGLEKSIELTKESILYNEKFKIYSTLLISYSNLLSEYLRKHRNHPEAIYYLQKLEKFADEAFSKNSIEEEQYLFSNVKALSYYLENWELSKARNNIKKIEKLITNPSKYPIYYEFLSHKGIYLLRIGKTKESLEILNLMESILDNKLYIEYVNFYFYLGFEIFLYTNDLNLLSKIEKKLLEIDINRIEYSIFDHDLFYLYNFIIFNNKIKKSLKEQILGKDYKFNGDQTIAPYYKIYEYYEKLGKFEVTQDLNKELDDIASNSRYVGDIFYSFLDNFISYLISNQKEFLLNALLNCKLIYSKLSEKERKIFKSMPIVSKFQKINNSFLYYLSHDKSFNSFIEKSSENIKVTFEIINKFLERFKNTLEENIEDMFNLMLKFLIHYGYCTYAGIYKIDETYSIKIVKSIEKNGYKRFSQEYYERCLKIFLTQSSPFIIKTLSYDGLKPHIFIAIPILDYSNRIIRKESSRAYKLDEYSYFLIFETQKIINPFWSVNGEFATFLENIISFLNNQYLLVQENMYDPLTKVLVRNNFLNKLKNALSKVKFGTILFIDIDNFKLINDIYSHDFGDKVLNKVAGIIKSSVRKVDIVGRYGGEEFLVFIPLISEEDAITIAERIRTNVMNENILTGQKITVTIGLSNYPKDSIFSDILISKAEVANRYGKLTGKNRIVIFNNQISLESYSNKYINGLIVRDPIKTSENAKILIELLQLAAYDKNNFEVRLEKGFELIQKTIYFDYYIVMHKKKIIISNEEKIFDELVNKINKLSSSGLIMINGSIFNYCVANYKDFYFCIGNFKNSQYLQEQSTLFQLYCNTFLLNESHPSNI